MANYGRAVVEDTLDALGIDYDEPFTSVWAQAFCPMHDDSSPSFTVNMEEGGWRCYSGCGSSGDLAALVAEVTNERYDDARLRLQRAIPRPKVG